MKDAYTGDYPQLRVAIRDGSNYPLSHRLTYYASNFASDTPLSQAVALGFYDPPDANINAVSIPSFLNTMIHPCSLKDTVQVDQAPPLRRSGSTHVPVAEVRAGVHQQRLRRRSSIQTSSTVGEGSNPRKRELSPAERDAVVNKRARTYKASQSAEMEMHQKETGPSGEPRSNTANEKRQQGSRDPVSWSHSRSFYRCGMKVPPRKTNHPRIPARPRKAETVSPLRATVLRFGHIGNPSEGNAR